MAVADIAGWITRRRARMDHPCDETEALVIDPRLRLLIEYHRRETLERELQECGDRIADLERQLPGKEPPPC